MMISLSAARKPGGYLTDAAKLSPQHRLRDAVVSHRVRTCLMEIAVGAAILPGGEAPRAEAFYTIVKTSYVV